MTDPTPRRDLTGLVPDRIGPLRHARFLAPTTAGSESTVTVGVR
ncbi:hypothetical protein [Streptomyces eurythermus]